MTPISKVLGLLTNKRLGQFLLIAGSILVIVPIISFLLGFYIDAIVIGVGIILLFIQGIHLQLRHPWTQKALQDMGFYYSIETP